jgi:diadenosine tetraphosphate (Ap4A) HIT family hydrolase
MEGCFACDLTAGRLPLPGGVMHRTGHWVVEHCVGPLGLGTLIVKPVGHVTAVADLIGDEAVELGPLLQRVSAVATELVPGTDQIYNCLWSHKGGVPVHMHYVVQPVTRELMAAYDAHGPGLQLVMFTGGTEPDPADVQRVAEEARRRFAG